MLVHVLTCWLLTFVKVADVVKQHPVPVAVAGTGILIAAVPGIITAPIMGIAGLMGFTSGGIAAGTMVFPLPFKWGVFFYSNYPCASTDSS